MRRLKPGLTGLVGFAAAVAFATPAHAAEAGAARLLATSSGSESNTVHGACNTWSSSTGSYGYRCSGGGRAKSFRDVLAGANPPTCWLLAKGSTDPTPADLAPFGTVTTAPELTPSPEPTRSPVPDPTGTPTGSPTAEPVPTTTVEVPEPTVTETTPVELPEEFTKVCLTATPDPDSLAPARNSSFTFALVTLLRSAVDRPPFWWELTGGQRRYVSFAEDFSGSIDAGTLTTSPSRSPRIGQVVAFSATDTASKVIGVGDLGMRAVLLSLSVNPGEPGRTPVVCQGAGQALAAGATDRTGEGICSFRYEETSGGRGTLAADTFDVTGTETWEIQVSTDGGANWQRERLVDKSVRTGLRVTEVQTLVVPLAP